MKKTEDLQPVIQSKYRLQYFVAFYVQTIQKESHEKDDDLHDDDAELHQ